MGWDLERASGAWAWPGAWLGWTGTSTAPGAWLGTWLGTWAGGLAGGLAGAWLVPGWCLAGGLAGDLGWWPGWGLAV